VQQLITFAVFSMLVLLLCLVRPGAGRIFLGIFFLVMAVGVNVVLVLVAPGQFVALGTDGGRAGEIGARPRAREDRTLRTHWRLESYGRQTQARWQRRSGFSEGDFLF
jgi:hypothetical protein